jgi:hypothetical protein
VNGHEKRIKGSYMLEKAEYGILNDSSIVEGFVYDVQLKKHVNQGSVYIKDTKIGTFVDTNGYFSLKIPAGECVFIATSMGCTDMPTNKTALKKNGSLTIFVVRS